MRYYKKNFKGNEKSGKLINNILFSFIIKGGSVIVSFFMMPAYINFLFDETILGMWFTAISLLSWILTFDFGIGNGLRNYLVEPLMNGKENEAKKFISSAYISVGIIVLFLSMCSFIFIPLLNWNSIFNISINKISSETLVFMSTMLIVGILIQFWFRLLNSIFYAMQKPALPGLLNLFSNLLMLIFTLFAKTDNIILNVKILSIAYVFTANIPYVFATMIIFSTKLRKMKPSFNSFDKKFASKVVKLGGTFFYLQILTMIMFSSNELFISWLVDPKDVVVFQIYNKLFSIISTFFNLAVTPVWSAVTEAKVIKDYEWIKNLYLKLNKMLLILIPLEIILLIFMPIITQLWLGVDKFEVNYIYAIIFSIYNVLFMKVGIDTNMIAGLGTLKIQSISFSITIVLKVFLSFTLTYIGGDWIYIIIANIISLLPYIIIEYFDIKYRFNILDKEK